MFIRLREVDEIDHTGLYSSVKGVEGRVVACECVKWKGIEESFPFLFKTQDNTAIKYR